MLSLFDSHCHLHFPQFDADRAEVLARMQKRCAGAVLIGTDLATSRAAFQLASEHAFLWAAVGLHPNDNPEERFDVDAFDALAREQKVVAIGECGLDYFRSGATPQERASQKERLLFQIELAERVEKPLVIHCREAHDDMLALLEERRPSVPIVMHFFTATAELAERYLALGCYLSFPGPVTYTAMYDEAIRLCPLERLLIETDAPFAAPVPHRGKRNEPVYVAHVAEKVAAVKGLSAEEIERVSTENALRVFKCG